MDNKELSEHVDIQRWLINNGLITDGVKNQLFFCGSIAHKEVQAVELDIFPQDYKVTYVVYVPGSLIKDVELYNQLLTRTDLIGMWRFKRLLKKQGSLDLQSVLAKFVLDYLGPKWKTEVTLVDFAKYEEAIGAKNGPQTDQRDDKPSD